jgi:hypothetical protein
LLSTASSLHPMLVILMKAMQIENRNLHKLVTLTSKSLKIHMSRSYHQVIPLERYGVGQKLLHHHTIKRGKTENKEMTEPLAKTQLTPLSSTRSMNEAEVLDYSLVSQDLLILSHCLHLRTSSRTHDPNRREN